MSVPTHRALCLATHTKQMYVYVYVYVSDTNTKQKPRRGVEVPYSLTVVKLTAAPCAAEGPDSRSEAFPQSDVGMLQQLLR